MAKNLTKAIAVALVATMGASAFAQTSLSVKTDRSKMNASAVSLKPQSPSTMVMMSSNGNQADMKAEAAAPQKVPCVRGTLLSAPAREAGSDTYFNSFDDPASFEIFDENGDEKLWTIGNPSSGGNGENCAFINYNSSMAMDDWMISEGVQLEGGKGYEVSLDVWVRSGSYPEKVEVFMGTTRTPAGMTIEAIPVYIGKETSPQTVSAIVVAPTSGTYYFGIHGCSDPDTYTLYVDNLKVGAPMSVEMPDKVQNLAAVQKEGEEGIAVVTFSAPTKRFSGLDLNGLTKLELLRDNIVIQTYNNPAPGADFTYEDVCGSGKFTWSAIAYNEDGASVPVSVSASIVGTAEVPYRKDFPTADSMDEMTIIDADGDDNTWGWDQYQHYARLSSPQGGSDDWLISVPINLKAGKVYEFSSLVSAGNPEAFPPKIGFYVGNAPTVEAMTNAIVPATQITKYDTYFDEDFTVPADGKYWIGVHGCSTEFLALIKLMWFEVKGGAEINGPAAPMDVVVNPDWTGRTFATDISFTAPVTTGAGDNLTSMTKIEILRNGSVVKTFENPTPGAEYSCTDVAPSKGEYIYAIVPYNTVGQGKKVERSVVLGATGRSVPYVEDFHSDASYDEDYTFIDNNEDGTCYWHATLTNPPYIWVHHGDSSPTNDDWAITPAIALEENTQYYFSVDAWGFKEGMELRAGSAPTIEGLTEIVVPKVDLTGQQATYGGVFTSTYAGNYFFAIRALSEDRIDTFYATNVSITKIGALSGPSCVTDLTFVPAGNGLDISFKAPTKTVGGENLSTLTSIEVLRDGESIKTFENPAPGATLTLNDTPEEEGEVTYTIIPVLDETEGYAISHVAFIGDDLPAQPQNVVAEYVGNGKVKVTWDPVTTTAHGVSVPAKGYIILEVDCNGKQKQIGQTTDSEFSYDAIDPEDQMLFNYGIFPVNANDEVGEYGYSNGVYAGSPYKMSYRESFSDGSFTSVINITPIIFEGIWYLATNETFSDVDPADGDNGFIAMRGGSGTTARLETGIIDLATNSTSPTLTFSTYVINNDTYDNEIYVDVCEAGTNNWTQVFGSQIKDLADAPGWTRVQVDLAAYKGKNVMIALRPVGRTYLYTIMDAIRVSNLTNKDVGIDITTSSNDVIAGENTDAKGTVVNNGQQDVESCQVQIFKNDELLKTLRVRNLAAGAAHEFSIKQTLDVADLDEVKFYAKAILDGDENEGDNTSRTLTFNVVKPIYPVVQNLSATSDKSNVTLSWDAPSMDNVAPAPYTETFETAQSWNQTGVCDWTFVDVDGAPTGGFQQFEFPGITTNETVTSFFVVDQTESTLGGYGPLFYGAENSDKSLGAFLTYTGAACDDWAISPELYGGRQTALYYVKGLLEDNPETFQAYYSTGSTNPDDFLPLGKVMSYNGDWTQVACYLPEGAKRFAIRHMSTSGALMMVDNVTLRLAGADPEDLALVGYNVYCDGERVNGAPIEDTTYTTENLVDGLHRYSVSAVYDEGESNTVHANVQVSEITNVNDVNLSVIGTNGAVVIRGAEGLEITVAAADGKVIFTGVGENNMRIAAEAGVCVVKAGNRTFKVVVK